MSLQAATRTAASIAAVLLILGTGLAHGLWSGRWKVSDEIRQAAARLDQVPTQVGAWQGEDLTGPSPEEVEVSQFAGHLVRRYRDATTDATVTVMVACGHPGPLSLHSPVWCYAGSGYRETAHPHEESLRCGSSIQSTLFSRPAADDGSSRLQVVWCWSADGTWRAPESPRLYYARDRVLFKLYAVIQVDQGRERESGERCREFLEEFLPALKPALFPEAAT